MISGLAALTNLLFFLLQIFLLGKWEQISYDPFVISFLAAISIFCLAESWLGVTRCEVIEVSKKNRVDLILTQITGVVLLVVFSASLCEHLIYPVDLESSAHIVTGTATVLLGVHLRVSAFRKLENAFFSMPKVTVGQQLVVGGIYSFVRHPSEIGLVCISLGIVWLLSSLLGFLVLVLMLLPISYFRVAREESCLSQVFDKDYRHYKNNTPAIFPILGRKRAL
jgi:protein-S-isoprenylcysteine O-methyltransferase Ste14